MLTQELAVGLVLLVAFLAAAVALKALRYYHARTREAQAARQRERRLNELTLAIGSSLDLTTVLREVLHAAISLTNSSGAVFGTLQRPDLLVIDPSLVVNLSVGEPIAMPRDQSELWMLLDDGRPFTQTRHAGRAVAIPALAAPQVQSVAAVRVRTNQQIAGVLMVVSSQRRRVYSNHDIDLLQVLGSQAGVAIQNARLFANKERQVRQLEALRITLSDISSKLELNRLLQTIVQRATELLAGDAGFVSLYDERSKHLIIQACYHFQPELPGQRIALGEGVTGGVAQSRTPVVVHPDDASADARLSFERGMGQTLMAVPMIGNNQLMGVIVVATGLATRLFDDDDIQLLNMFAQQVTIAIQNANSYEEEVRSADRRRKIYQASLDIGGTLNTSEVYAKIHSAVKSIIPCDTFTVVLQDIQRHRPVVVYQEPPGISGDDDIPLAGLVDEVLERGASILVDDPGTASLYGKHTNLVVPMKLGLQVMGVLVVQAPLAERYDALDLESLELLASTCAIGLRNAQLFGEVQRLAITDALTGVYNRRHFLDLSHTELARTNRSPAPIAMLMIDIDQFKHINDTYGHSVGDRALQTMVQCCRGTLRTIDILGRFGGEEFAVLLSGADEGQAMLVAERLRQQIASVPISLGDRDITITVSIGVAMRPEHSTLSLQALLEHADKALYQAKSGGRNRVRLWDPPRLGV